MSKIGGEMTAALIISTVAAAGVLLVQGTGLQGASGQGRSVYDITKYGALSSPNDIGPAFQAAANACVAAGGGTIYIPPRANGGIWGWATYASVNAGNKVSLVVAGEPGETAIMPTANVTLFDIGNPSNALIHVDGLTFVGNPLTGVDVPCLFEIRQTRLAILSRVNVFGVRANATNYGCIRIIADSVVAYGCVFTGCDYAGTSGQGGVLCITGARDSLFVYGMRFQSSIGDANFRGTTYYKSSVSTNAWLWIGGQGADADSIAYGLVEISSCIFESAGAGVLLRPEPGYVIRSAVLRGLAFNQGAGLSVDSQAQYLQVDSCQLGNSAAGTVAVSALGRVLMRWNRNPNGGKKIRFAGATAYFQDEENEGLSYDTSIATPSAGIKQSNGTRTVIYP